MSEAYICDAIRTPFGRYGGALSSVRTDDLAALPIKALMERNPQVDWKMVDDVIYGCANQAGEDNRNVAHMASLLAGMPVDVPGVTVNRLCGSSMEATGTAARAIKSGETDLMIAGGVESMSRAPFVLAKADSAFSRAAKIEDTTIGWRFINPLMKKMYGVDSMPETAENVAVDFKISRADQDAFALRSQQRYAAAFKEGFFKNEIAPVTVPQRKGDPLVVDKDEHPRETSLESLAKLKGVVREDGTVTAGNASGVNDGACALLLASETAIKQHGLVPKARILAMGIEGVPPRIMGFGPAPAMRKVLEKAGLKLGQMDVIELNEAFAAQGLAVTRDHGLPDDPIHVNPNGGAIAIGHPLGASGARLIATAMYQLQRIQGRYALCTMCIGVGEGIAVVIERIVATSEPPVRPSQS
ncbi:MAG: 3-oxoadipyl-CoA thiolase [Pseudomonadota bacterium]|nr:3-oxoadipyl-CoA thiolase [Pseudomonadota bacterium]